MGLHYLTFMRINLENREKLTLDCVMNSVGMNNKIIVNYVGIFNDSVAMNSISLNNTKMNNVSYELCQEY